VVAGAKRGDFGGGKGETPFLARFGWVRRGISGGFMGDFVKIC